MIEKSYTIGTIDVATDDDARSLAGRLRTSDLVELAAYTDVEPEPALLQTLRNSKFALALRDAEGVPVSLLGVGWLANPRAGRAWFVSCEALDDFALVFLEQVRVAFGPLVAGHDVVSNWVHAPNVKTLRWLRWLGFEELDRMTSERSGETLVEMARFASPAVRELYVGRDWASYHASLPEADALRRAGFALAADGVHGSSLREA